MCQRGDSKSEPLLNGDINNYNTMDDEELKIPPYPVPKPLSSINVNSEEKKTDENNST